MTLKPYKPKGVSNMGFTHVAVTVRGFSSKEPEESYTADFLVDTGAWHSMASASELKKIGIQPRGSKAYELASGEVVEYPYGLAELSFLDDVAHTEIIFGPDNTEPILGVLALESAGYMVDTRNQSLRKLKSLPLKALALKSVA
jgi:predicted aspartyl protease